MYIVFTCVYGTAHCSLLVLKRTVFICELVLSSVCVCISTVQCFCVVQYSALIAYGLTVYFSLVAQYCAMITCGSILHSVYLGHTAEKQSL